MNAAKLTGSMLAIATLFPLAAGCEGPMQAPEPAAEIARDLRIGGLPPILPPIVVKPPPPGPTVSDLKMDGTMRFYPAGNQIGVQLNVVNVGNAPAVGPSGQVNIGGFTANGALFQYFGGTPAGPNTVNPGQRGYVQVYLPAGFLVGCNKYLTHLDTTRTMQSGSPDPFLNDEANVATQCLEWTSPITSDNFFISDPIINGNTLGRIVSSITVGRKSDGKLCSHCHFTGCGLSYCPPVAPGGNASIWPDQVINGRTWRGPGGYARGFLAMPTDDHTQVRSKPFYLQALVQTWIDHGERATQSIVVGDPGGGVFTRF
jgi:hypothetical protein